MSEKLEDYPAFPNDFHPNNDPRGNGISKRFYAACSAMQGIISYSKCGMMIPPNVAKLAYEYADELLRQESCEP